MQVSRPIPVEKVVRLRDQLHATKAQPAMLTTESDILLKYERAADLDKTQ